MAHRTIVSIYEVDEWATTGPWVGQGSLVNRGIVLVHPPLSDKVIGGQGPKRLRVGVFPSQEDTYPGQFVEVIDVWGEPQVLRPEATDTPALVALELRTPAQSPQYNVPDVDWTMHSEENFQTIAEHLQALSERDWNPSGGEDALSLICKLWPGKCTH